MVNLLYNYFWTRGAKCHEAARHKLVSTDTTASKVCRTGLLDTLQHSSRDQPKPLSALSTLIGVIT